MRFAMPAFRTQAGADRASREGTSHATSALSNVTLSLSPAQPLGSGTISSWHCHVLLSRRSSFSSLILSSTRSHSAATAPTATGATGHGKGVALQVATEPGLYDLAQVAGDERDHPDAISGDHLMERPGDRATNQRTDAKFHQTMRLLGRQVLRQDFPCFRDDPPRLGLDDVNPPCDVEHRRDPIVPGCKCRFHHPTSFTSFPHG